MASVNFLIRSSKQNECFTARLQYFQDEALTFTEAKTEIFVFYPSEVLENPMLNGKKFWSKYKKYKGTDLHIKNIIVRTLNNQEYLRKFILEKFEAGNFFDMDEAKKIIPSEFPTKSWLHSIIKEYYNDLKKREDLAALSDTPLDIQWHFDNYIKLKGKRLADRTILKLKDAKKIIGEFESYQSSIKGYDVKYCVNDVNPDFQYYFEKFLSENKSYSHNTIAKAIKVLRTICIYSKNYGINLDARFELVKLAYEETDIIYLSFSELEKIKNKEMPEHLEDARDWLYLSAFLGQRIGDFMKFNSKMVRKENDDYFIDFIQEKTKKKIALLLHPAVIEILKKRNMEFPSFILDQTYNEQIKIVCQIAEIDENIEGSILTEIKENTWRNVKGLYPKWKLIGSHIGRKSFCTNFYSKIPTSLILEVSGHTEERTLLSYIGKKDNTNAKMIKNYYSNIDITKD